MKAASFSLKLLISLVILSLAANLAAASKSNLGKEKRWKEQIVPTLMVGEAVSLKARGNEFLALYTENNAKQSFGGIILIHGSGVHPAWPDIIEPLRTTLPDHGWHTLSLQMPILANGVALKEYATLYSEVPARIQAGIDYLKAKGIRDIALVAHSLGTSMSSYYLARQNDPSIRAFVAISFGPGIPTQAEMNSFENLAKIKIPTLDIYGSEDYQGNLQTINKRKLIARKAGNKNYSQVKIEGANHLFTAMDDQLIKRIRGWLKRYMANPLQN